MGEQHRSGAAAGRGQRRERSRRAIRSCSPSAGSATFQRRKILLVSTPKTKGLSRIEREYEQSDQRRFFVPCPHCDEPRRWSSRTSAGPKAGRVRPSTPARTAARLSASATRPGCSSTASGVGEARTGAEQEQRRIPPLQPLQPGRLVQLGRCRRDVRRRREDARFDEGLRQHGARPAVRGGGRGAGLA